MGADRFSRLLPLAGKSFVAPEICFVAPAAAQQSAWFDGSA
jgi:hypothetical protein